MIIEKQKPKQIMRAKNQNKIFGIGVGIVFCLLFLWPNNAAAQTVTTQEILQLVNNKRIEQNLQPLAVNYQLERAAWQRANDMIAKNYFSHQSPEGLMPWDFVLQEKYDYQFLGENLALDWPTADKTVQAWMDSLTHRNNILNQNFQETGVAIMINDDHHLVVQLFGQRANYISETENQTENQLAINNQIPIMPVNMETPLTSVSPIISDSTLTENNSVLGATTTIKSAAQTIQHTINTNYLLFFMVISYFPIIMYLHLQFPPVKTSL